MLLGIRGDFLTWWGLSSAGPNRPPSLARSHPSLRQQEGQTYFLFLGFLPLRTLKILSG